MEENLIWTSAVIANFLLQMQNNTMCDFEMKVNVMEYNICNGAIRLKANIKFYERQYKFFTRFISGF